MAQSICLRTVLGLCTSCFFNNQLSVLDQSLMFCFNLERKLLVVIIVFPDLVGSEVNIAVLNERNLNG